MTEVYLFGDSITWGSWDPEAGGWAQRLKREVDRIQLARPDMWCPVYNLGISGDTASGVVARIEAEVSARHEDNQEIAIVVAIGVNDSMIELPSMRDIVKLDDFTESLAMIHSFAKRVSAKIAFVGLAPVDEPRLNPLPWNPSRAYTFERARLFNEAVSGYCATSGVPFVDLWSTWTLRSWRSLLHDGLHPNSSGHAALYDEVRELVVKRWLGIAEPKRN